MKAELTFKFDELEAPEGVFNSTELLGCQVLKSVIVPEGVTVLGPYVFSWSSLEEIQLPSTLKRIHSSAFQGCAFLEKIRLPEGLTHLGASAFERSGLRAIEIPGSVTYVGPYAFSYCTHLKKLTVHEGCKELSEGAFYRCWNLEDIQLPKGIELGEKCFDERKRKSC